MQQAGKAETIQRAPDANVLLDIIIELLSGTIRTTDELISHIGAWPQDDLQILLDELGVVAVDTHAQQERLYMAMDLIHETLGPESFDPAKANADLVGPEARKRAAGTGRWSIEPDDEGMTIKRKTQRTYVQYANRSNSVGCMVAVYGGLSNLLPAETVKNAQDETTREGYAILQKTPKAKNAITLSRFISKLRPQGMVGEHMRFEYSAQSGTWTPDVEDKLLAVTEREKVPGLYFFAVSLSSYHTGIILVDRTDIDAPKLFWLDQFGGISQNLSTRNGLTKDYKETHANWGYPPTYKWIIMPTDDVVEK